MDGCGGLISYFISWVIKNIPSRLPMKRLTDILHNLGNCHNQNQTPIAIDAEQIMTCPVIKLHCNSNDSFKVILQTMRNNQLHFPFHDLDPNKKIASITLQDEEESKKFRIVPQGNAQTGPWP